MSEINPVKPMKCNIIERGPFQYLNKGTKEGWI